MVLSRIERSRQPLLPAERPIGYKNSEDRANPFELAFMLDIRPTQRKAEDLDADMEKEDLEMLTLRDTGTEAYPIFEKEWVIECKKKEPKYMNALIRTLYTDILKCMFWSIIVAGMPFTGVILLEHMQDFVKNTNDPMWHAGVMACIMFASQILLTVAEGQRSRLMTHLAVRTRTVGAMAMYRKTTMLSAKSRGEHSGSIFNVFSADVQRLSEYAAGLFMSLEVPFQVVGAWIYLFVKVGWPAVGGLAVYFIVIPFNYQISQKFIGTFIKKMMAGDARVKKVVEILNSVRVIKFYAWEAPFEALVTKLRAPELVHVAELLKQLALLLFSFAMAAPCMQLAIFIILASINPSDMSVLLFFESMALINILNLTMVRVPFMYSMFLQFQIGSARITKVLIAEEKAPLAKDGAATLHETGYIELKNASFYWEKPDKVVLKDVNFECKPGELVMVVGLVGAGKTSLINAMLGELVKSQGELKIGGQIAYVPQTAWILNTTLRNNICLNKPYNRAKYEKVIQACALGKDVLTLPSGDLTEIGEKGVNISGGQRQRVSLARALYQDADIYLLDDPLSALDAHVGRHVFEKACRGMLADKTVVLVTHQLGFLSEANRIYVADDDRLVLGDLSTTTRASEPTNEGDMTPLQKLVKAWNTSRPQDEAPPENFDLEPPLGDEETYEAIANASFGSQVSGSAMGHRQATSISNMGRQGTGTASMTKSSFGKADEVGMGKEEERQSGSVKASTFFFYLKSFGAVFFWIAYWTFIALGNAAMIFSQLWMGWWTERKWASIRDRPAEFFLGIYAAAIGFSAICVLCRELVWRHGAVNAPRQMYGKMLTSVLSSPMTFFDTTPLGRIINRFTRDTELLDFAVPNSVSMVLSLGAQQLGSLVAISIIMPYYIPIAVGAILVLMAVSWNNSAAVTVRRLTNSANAPVLSLFSECVSGATTIRGCGLTNYFLDVFSRNLDIHGQCTYADRIVFELLRVKINIVAAFIGAGTILIVLAMRDSLSQTLTAFVLVQSMQFNMFIGWLMFQRQNMSVSMNSVERVVEFCELTPEPTGNDDPPPKWPSVGNVIVKDVCAHYREGLPRVLKDVSFTVKGGQKVGICGRTGSGKSSMLLALFRMLPLLSGSQIVIDGVDTGTLKSRKLREKLSAIPQEPVLFAGTVLENLDPFRKFDRAVLTKALKMCHLIEPLEALRASKNSGKKDGDAASLLDTPVTDSDLSNGQKQLLCLARSMVRENKILVLDEATSSVDAHTDKLIQETIRTAFADCTVLTVAHRINTIIDSDVILVMDQGRVAEFDSPKKLMDDANSMFAQLVKEANDQGADDASPKTSAKKKN